MFKPYSMTAIVPALMLTIIMAFTTAPSHAEQGANSVIVQPKIPTAQPEQKAEDMVAYAMSSIINEVCLPSFVDQPFFAQQRYNMGFTDAPAPIHQLLVSSLKTSINTESWGARSPYGLIFLTIDHDTKKCYASSQSRMNIESFIIRHNENVAKLSQLPIFNVQHVKNKMIEKSGRYVYTVTAKGNEKTLGLLASINPEDTPLKGQLGTVITMWEVQQ